MTEPKFPQDYDVEAWVDLHRETPWFTEHEEVRLREDHALRKAGPAGFLAHAALTICNLVNEDGKLADPDSIAFRATVKGALGLVAVHLEGALPNTRWCIQDYQMKVSKDEDGKMTLDEHIRPIDGIVHDYWKAVSN